jgi:probable addiction module antidote protein
MNPKAAEKLGIKPFDAAAYLESEEDCAQYLSAVMADGDPAVVAVALGDIAKARGMSQVARDAGITREGLYKALGEQGNPSFSTIMKVVEALGLRLAVQPVTHG